MRGKRLLPVLVAAVGFLVAFVDPVAAAQYESVTEQLIQDLNSKLLAAALPITLLVEGILVYTVWKFRNNEEPQATKENRRLEITWTAATAVVLLFVGVAAYGVMGSVYVTATPDSVDQVMAQEDTVVVDAIGVQWYWQFEYPEENVTSRNTMVVPEDTTLLIRTEAQNVIHSFHAPGVGLKADAFPGQKNYIVTNITETGTYQIYCAEFCGAGHSQMLAKLVVVEEQKYQAWTEDPQNVSV